MVASKYNRIVKLMVCRRGDAQRIGLADGKHGVALLDRRVDWATRAANRANA